MKKAFSLILCTVSIVYTLWYMHYAPPWTTDGALSTVGLEHRALFTTWGVLTFVSLYFALFIAYQIIRKTRLLLPFFLLSFIGMALTLIFRFDYDIKPDYYLHCIGSLVFSVVTSGAVFLLFFLAKSTNFWIATAVITLSDLLLLCFFKENGIIETLPLFAGYMMLTIYNLRSDKIEAASRT